MQRSTAIYVLAVASRRGVDAAHEASMPPERDSLRWHLLVGQINFERHLAKMIGAKDHALVTAGSRDTQKLHDVELAIAMLHTPSATPRLPSLKEKDIVSRELSDVARACAIASCSGPIFGISTSQ